MLSHPEYLKSSFLFVFWCFSYVPVVYFVIIPLLIARWWTAISLGLPIAVFKELFRLPFALERRFADQFSGNTSRFNSLVKSPIFFLVNKFNDLFVIHERSRYIYYRYVYGFLTKNRTEGFTYKKVHLQHHETFKDYLSKRSTKSGDDLTNDNGFFSQSNLSEYNSLPLPEANVSSLPREAPRQNLAEPSAIYLPDPVPHPVNTTYQRIATSNETTRVLQNTTKKLEQLIRLNVNGQEIKLKLKSKPKSEARNKPLVSYISSIKVNDCKTISVIKQEIRKVFPQPGYDDGSLAPIILRLAWHCCATYDKYTNTGGSNGGTMRFLPEAIDEGNTGLHVAMSALQPVKEMFPEITYSDLWTLAGVVAIESMSGPIVEWKAGRYDCISNEKVPPNGRLPFGYKGREHVHDTFERMGFDDRETVALLGAHGLGRCHKKFSGWEGAWTSNPILFTNEFFKVLLNEEWKEGTVPETGRKQFYNADKSLMMLNTDLILTEDPDYLRWVKLYAEDEEIFRRDFSNAFAKLLELGIQRDQDQIVLPTKT